MVLLRWVGVLQVVVWGDGVVLGKREWEGRRWCLTQELTGFIKWERVLGLDEWVGYWV